MSDPVKALTTNKFIDKMMSWLPDDPVVQTQYMYFLTSIVVLGLAGFSIASWIEVWNIFIFSTFFRAIFMSAITVLSAFGLKQTRNAYLLTKQFASQPQEEMVVESIEEMMREFKDDKGIRKTEEGSTSASKKTKGRKGDTEIEGRDSGNKEEGQPNDSKPQ